MLSWDACAAMHAYWQINATKMMMMLLQFLDGATLQGVFALNKIVRQALQQEQRIYTVDNPCYIHGTGFRTII